MTWRQYEHTTGLGRSQNRKKWVINNLTGRDPKQDHTHTLPPVRAMVDVAPAIVGRTKGEGKFVPVL